ncbi:MAG: CopG family antitoxin [bacterium]
MNKNEQKLKKIPRFKNEDEERDFWAIHDSTDYFDWSKAIVNPKFPNLKFSSKSISLRLVKVLDTPAGCPSPKALRRNVG